MVFPERFSNLPEYAFPRLRALLSAHQPGGAELRLSIGEPNHAMPDFVGRIIAENLSDFGVYPPGDGSAEVLAAISGWLARRYGVEVAEDRLCITSGSREALFITAIALCPETKGGAKPAVLVPNPFYQVYAVAALSAGAEPVYLPATRVAGFLPDFSAVPGAVLDRTAIAYLCSPSNPQGAVADADYWATLLALAEKHDFRVFADECYSEVWRGAKPVGALEAAAAAGADPERVVVFNSLSKRSNLPGLRVGFVAGGPETIRNVRRLRSYAGPQVPLALQRVAEAAWRDEAHVEASRRRYVAKYEMADRIFAGLDGCAAPQGGFFLWLPVGDGEAAAVKLWQKAGVRVLPGGYLGRDSAAGNPGEEYIRVALVAGEDELERGLQTIRDCLFA